MYSGIVGVLVSRLLVRGTSPLFLSEVYKVVHHKTKAFGEHFQAASELRSSRLYTQFSDLRFHKVLFKRNELLNWKKKKPKKVVVFIIFRLGEEASSPGGSNSALSLGRMQTRHKWNTWGQTQTGDG